MQDMVDARPQSRPLRRRAALLVGAWVTDIKPADKPAVYRAMLSLMADDDEAIALAGFKAMHSLIDDWGFREHEFLDFVEPSFKMAALQMRAVNDHESQLQVHFLAS